MGGQDHATGGSSDGVSSKQAYEQFRVRKFGGGHPMHSAPALDPGTAAADEAITPDANRVILAFDIDSFYAQCEEVRDPSLRGKPVGVTQKYLVVTANYTARAAGVGKLMSIRDAMQKCPDLVLVPGEDLGPYREASACVLRVLSRYGPACRLGLDEVWVDATAVVRERLAAGVRPGGFVGHVYQSGTPLVADTRWRPQDLRVAPAAHGPAGPQHVAPLAQASADAGQGWQPEQPAWVPLLQVGSAVAAEARTAVLSETGFKLSAGIACNKALAKLVAGLHKPNDQTVLPPPEAAWFLAPLPVRALPGVGFKTESDLAQLGVATVAELRKLERTELTSRLGERVGTLLWSLARGLDASPVVAQGPPKSITVEDSFKSCKSLQAAQAVLQVLAPDLIARVVDDHAAHSRWPATLTIRWRVRGDGMQRSGASVPWPITPTRAYPTHAPIDSAGHGAVAEQQVSQLVDAGLGVLSRHLQGTAFSLTLINMGATNFKPSSAMGAGVQLGIRQLLATAGAGAGQKDAQPQLLRSSSPYKPGANAGPVPKPWNEESSCSGEDSGAVSEEDRLRHVQQDGGPQLERSGQLLLPSHAAQASTSLRRDYGSGSPALGLLLPKSRERQLREQGGSTGGPITPRQHIEPTSELRPQDASSVRVHVVPTALPAPYLPEKAEAESSPSAQPSLPDKGLLHYELCDSWEREEVAAVGVAVGASTAPLPPHGADGRDRAALGGATHAARVILHCDVDCFYCQVERLDDPTLVGVPLAVKQFNSGGFVAVSYEARAAGVKCGDGVGSGGRAALPHLREIGAVSEEEARRRCPGLQVRPMRTARYREVSDQVEQVLRGLAPSGVVEKTSYDDVYMDVTAAALDSTVPAPDEQPAATKVATDASWLAVCAPLRRGVALAHQMRRALQGRLGLTMSVGVAVNKLLARCVGPLNKPDCVTVLPVDCAMAFMADVSIRSVPSLRGKAGEEVVASLGVMQVGQLARFSRVELEARFGRTLGARLALLPLGLDGDAPVVSRGPQKSLLVERSYPALSRFAAVRQALEPLTVTLWSRMEQDTSIHARLPTKLSLTWRQGYTSPRSKTCDMPVAVLTALRTHLGERCSRVAGSVPQHQAAGEGEDAAHRVQAPMESPAGLSSEPRLPEPGHPDFAPCHALLEAACWVFKAATGASGGRTQLQITRLAVSALYTSSGSSLDASQQRISRLWGQAPEALGAAKPLVAVPQHPNHSPAGSRLLACKAPAPLPGASCVDSRDAGSAPASVQLAGLLQAASHGTSGDGIGSGMDTPEQCGVAGAGSGGQPVPLPSKDGDTVPCAAPEDASFAFVQHTLVRRSQSRAAPDGLSAPGLEDHPVAGGELAVTHTLPAAVDASTGMGPEGREHGNSPERCPLRQRDDQELADRDLAMRLQQEEVEVARSQGRKLPAAWFRSQGMEAPRPGGTSTIPATQRRPTPRSLKPKQPTLHRFFEPKQS